MVVDVGSGQGYLTRVLGLKLQPSHGKHQASRQKKHQTPRQKRHQTPEQTPKSKATPNIQTPHHIPGGRDGARGGASGGGVGVRARLPDVESPDVGY